MKLKYRPIPIKLEVDPTRCMTTAFAGIMPYLDLWNALGMPSAVDETVSICGTQGWLDRQVVLSLVLLNLIGGDCVTDVEKLEDDGGLRAMVRAGEFSGMSREQRSSAQKRFRGGRSRTFPAPTQISSFLESCHNEAAEANRVGGKAFIPPASNNLKSLRALNTAVISQLQKRRPEKTATLDCDATLVPTENQSALFCYKGYRAYQPYNVWWAEQQVVLHSEFRDGNVPAGWNILAVIKDAVAALPPGVENVLMRQDTAAYQTDVMAWCERAGEHPEYGRILFTLSADVTSTLRAEIVKATDWSAEYVMRNGKSVRTGREWAELMYVPNAQAMLTDIFEPFRYIVVRERLGDQLRLLDIDSPSQQTDKLTGLPFPTMTMENVAYKIGAIVTNRRDQGAAELIRWHYGRCGKSEEAHSIMKEDFSGGQMPSAKFGANAAWWALMILSMNFESMLKRLVLGDAYIARRMKAIRHVLINTAGRIVHHSRQYCLRVSHDFHDWLASLREKAVAHYMT
jgi:Transposase DDE domain group 1